MSSGAVQRQGGTSAAQDPVNEPVSTLVSPSDTALKSLPTGDDGSVGQ